MSMRRPFSRYRGITRPGAFDELKAERDKLLSLLRELEWKGYTYQRCGYNDKQLVIGQICPCCEEDNIRDHRPDCALSNALKESR